MRRAVLAFGGPAAMAERSLQERNAWSLEQALGARHELKIGWLQLGASLDRRRRRRFNPSRSYSPGGGIWLAGVAQEIELA